MSSGCEQESNQNCTQKSACPACLACRVAGGQAVRVISMGPSSALGQAACAHQVVLQPLLLDGRLQAEQVAELCRARRRAARVSRPPAQGAARCARRSGMRRKPRSCAPCRRRRSHLGHRGRRWAAPITIQVSNRSESCDALACEGDMDSVLGCSDRSCRSRGPPVSASRTTIVLYRCTCGRARRVRRGEVHSQAPTAPRLPVASWRVRRQR